MRLPTTLIKKSSVIFKVAEDFYWVLPGDQVFIELAFLLA